jgi:PKD repeat protein
MSPWRRNVFVAALALLSTLSLRADCTLTNLGIAALNDLGFGQYKSNTGGLYPAGANSRPPAHEAAGLEIANNQIRPLSPAGTPTNNGKIVLLSLGMSNTTDEWASLGTSNFMALANADPGRNPQVVVVDGAQGGQDAILWTNANAATWSNVLQRLKSAGVTSNQVQVMWLKQALARPVNYGPFPFHAQSLQDDLAIILRLAKAKFTNLVLVYFSCRTRCYDNVATDLNPEPFAFETGFADKWVIEDQLMGRNNLNFDPSKGPVVAPWISWGAYIWTDGTRGRSDGFVSICPDDLQSDFTHPSANGGVPKVAHQLLAFFKTDVTTTPWFLRHTVVGQPPTCAPAANVTNGVMPLTVNFSANAASGSYPLRDAEWTFEDGDFSTQANPTKTFPAPGLYHARLTVTDTNGNTCSGSVAVNVTTTFALWQQAKFTASELANPAISGPAADPDHDGIVNLLEYAFGLEPKVPDASGVPAGAITNGYFTLTYNQYKATSDLTFTVEVSNDLITWNSGPAYFATVQTIDNGPTQTITVRETSPVSATAHSFVRLAVSR